MKRLLQITLLLLCMFAVRPAAADPQIFTDFSIDLPSGWSIEREGITVAFVAEDKSAIMMVTVESTAHMMTEGVTVEELAEAYAEELKGTKPKREEAN